MFVPKRDVFLRFWANYRTLNAVTKQHVCPISRMDRFIDSLETAVIFTLDTKTWCWKDAIEIEDQWNIAVSSQNGLLWIVGLPYGLWNAPILLNERVMSHFQRFGACLHRYNSMIMSFTLSMQERTSIMLAIYLHLYAKQYFHWSWEV